MPAKQDPITGQFVKGGTMSSERASEIGKLSHNPPKTDSRDQLLREQGYDDPDQAPELNKLLASIAAGRSAGAVAAMKELQRLSPQNVSGPDVSTGCPYLDECMIYRYKDEGAPAEVVQGIGQSLDSKQQGERHAGMATGQQTSE